MQHPCDPDEIGDKIERLHDEIRELHYAPVVTTEGDVVSFADYIDCIDP